MHVCAIISEYNPFHLGHLYQIEEYRKAHPQALMIAVMSGNFVQRGEPAIVDKWTRAEIALKSGIDIVIELPVYSAVQSADYFALGGVQLASLLGAKDLLCGVESGTSRQYLELATDWLEIFDQKDRLNAPHISLNEWINSDEQLSKYQTILTGSNNILAFSYAKAIIHLNAPLKLVTVKRRGQSHNDEYLGREEPFKSASAIRKHLNGGGSLADLSEDLPQGTTDLLRGKQWMNWDRLWPFLKYALLTQTPQQLAHIFQMEGGLEYRLQKAVHSSQNFNDFLSTIATKRYSQSRLRRLCLYVLLNIQAEKIEQIRQSEGKYRILGFTSAGQDYLSTYFKSNPSLKTRFKTNLSLRDNQDFQLDIRAGRVYQLALRETEREQDFKRKPLKIN